MPIKSGSRRSGLISPIEIYDYDHDDAEYLLNNPYECCACGRRFSDRKDNFLKSSSFLFGANDGYIPVCVDLQKALRTRRDKLGNGRTG